MIIDYGLGNLAAVQNMIKRAGGDVIISSSRADLKNANKFILPGIGHFGAGMRNLRSLDLIKDLEENVLVGQKPILGICLGAQFLGLGSEEGGEEGLGWLQMECKKFSEENSPYVPNMGWRVIVEKKRAFNVKLAAETSRYYFTHSYYMNCLDKDLCVATSMNGEEFCCVVEKRNIIGAQFHPEKSNRSGLQFMHAFITQNV